MAAVDPVLARGVKLLLSNDPDAADQLRAMLDEALRNKYGFGMKLPVKIEIEESVPDRRSYDSVSSSKIHSPSPPTAMSDESSGSASADIDDSFCMNFTELSCVVCGQFNVGVRNQLMECNSCQKLYHQDCHVPPVKELISASSTWDCADCSKKKQPKIKMESPVSGGKPASFASLGGSSVGTSSSSHRSSSKSGSSSSSSSSHKSSSKSSSGHGSSHSSHSSSSKRHSTSSSSSHKSSSHHKSSSSSSSRHSK